MRLSSRSTVLCTSSLRAAATSGGGGSTAAAVTGARPASFASQALAAQPLAADTKDQTAASPAAGIGGERRGSSSSCGVGEALTADSDIESAVRACFTQLGRSADDPQCATMAATLRDNWYSTAGDAVHVTEAQAVALRVPLRLLDMMRSLLRQPKDTQWPDASAAAAAKLPAAAASSLSDSDDLEAEAAAATAAEAVAEADSLSEADLTSAVRLAEKVSAAMPELDPDIMARRCPKRLPLRREAAGADVRVTSRKRLPPYALKVKELPERLAAEIEDFRKWATIKHFGAQSQPVAPVTCNKYVDHLRGILGWLANVQGVPLDELSLKHAVPSHDRQGMAVVFDYVQWLTRERGVNVRTEGVVIRSIMAAAKCLWRNESKVRPSEGDKSYSDLEVVKELRAMANTAKKAGKVAGRSSDEAKKWLDWPQYLALAEQLRLECAGLDASGQHREPRAVAWSLQRYLIFAILSCVPDRQRTLRELRVGTTLVKEGDMWMIRHSAGDYKTGRSYGERPPLTLAPHINPELEAFMDTWRAHLAPRHDFLFSRRDGLPLDDVHLYKLFWTTALRLSGKRMNPHLVRDSCISYLRGDGGATERELEALAIYMGHSVAMQRDTYDRRTKGQKVAPAVELLASLNRRAGGGATPV